MERPKLFIHVAKELNKEFCRPFTEVFDRADQLLRELIAIERSPYSADKQIMDKYEAAIKYHRRIVSHIKTGVEKI